jgi:uncharacterized protein (TIGR03067 family)
MSCSRRILTIALLALCPALGLSQERPEAKPAELKAKDLVGTYKIVESHKDGAKSPKETFDGTVVRFTDDSIVATDKEKKEVYSASYKLDASKSPAVIVMTSTLPNAKGAVANGLIERDGDTLRLIYTLPKELGGEDAPSPPKDFKTVKGQILSVMQKVKEPE